MKINSDTVIASVRHTVVVVFILAVVSLSSLGLSSKPVGQGAGSGSHTLLYLFVALGEWALVYYIWVGIKARKKITLKEMIFGSDRQLTKKDFLYMVGFWVTAVLIISLVKLLIGLSLISNQYQGVLPDSVTEYLTFFFLAISAGICEEIIYRGYFQRQFTAFFGNRYTAVALQGLIFGVSHGYQGLRHMVVIFIYGVLWGILVLIVKNLKPGILAHIWQDMFSGILFPGT